MFFFSKLNFRGSETRNSQGLIEIETTTTTGIAPRRGLLKPLKRPVRCFRGSKSKMRTFREIGGPGGSPSRVGGGSDVGKMVGLVEEFLFLRRF